MKLKIIKIGALALAVVAIGIQFVRPDVTNPPADPGAAFEAVAKPPQPVADVVRRACVDCHSHQTVWPWYSRIAPVSWLVAGDVREGRAHLNLSEWNLLSAEASQLKMRQMCAEMRKGDMPLLQYRLLHREARLSPAEVSAFCEAARPAAEAKLRAANMGAFATHQAVGN